MRRRRRKREMEGGSEDMAGKEEGVGREGGREGAGEGKD